MLNRHYSVTLPGFEPPQIDQLKSLQHYLKSFGDELNALVLSKAITNQVLYDVDLSQPETIFFAIDAAMDGADEFRVHMEEHGLKIGKAVEVDLDDKIRDMTLPEMVVMLNTMANIQVPTDELSMLDMLLEDIQADGLGDRLRHLGTYVEIIMTRQNQTLDEMLAQNTEHWDVKITHLQASLAFTAKEYTYAQSVVLFCQIANECQKSGIEFGERTEYIIKQLAKSSYRSKLSQAIQNQFPINE